MFALYTEEQPADDPLSTEVTTTIVEINLTDEIATTEPSDDEDDEDELEEETDYSDDVNPSEANQPADNYNNKVNELPNSKGCGYMKEIPDTGDKDSLTKVGEYPWVVLVPCEGSK